MDKTSTQLSEGLHVFYYILIKNAMESFQLVTLFLMILTTTVWLTLPRR